MVMGTPYYMAPEQLMAQTLSGHIDQFALAAVAYTMLTGQKPFEADTLTSLVTQILHSEPPPASTLNPLISRRTDAVLKKGMAKNPTERFKDCSAFAGAIEASFVPAKPAGRAQTPHLAWRRGSAGGRLSALPVFSRSSTSASRNPRQPSVRGKPPCTRTDRQGRNLRPAPAPAAAPQKRAAPSSSGGINSVDGLRYVRVPAGSFDIGCVDRDRLCSDDEKPRHTVNIPERILDDAHRSERGRLSQIHGGEEAADASSPRPAE